MITIYHNGRCSKSRGALEILQEQNIPHKVRWYLAEPLTAKELKTLLGKLSMPASGLVRKSESYYKEQLAGKVFSEEEWLEVLVENPGLIERPIVVNGRKALIARPAERVLDLL